MSVERNRQERRLEPRRPLAGGVRLWLENAMAAAIEAELVDHSPHGFRARHDCTHLTTGQAVGFEGPGIAGRARVVWTRMFGGRVESGFVFLAEERENRR